MKLQTGYGKETEQDSATDAMTKWHQGPPSDSQCMEEQAKTDLPSHLSTVYGKMTGIGAWRTQNSNEE